MKVMVVGTGNVGAALLFPLAYDSAIDHVGVVSRRVETANAAIMDVASAFPEGAIKMTPETADAVSDADIVVITSGITPKGKTVDEIHAPNLKIAESVLSAGPLKKSAIVICIATPVDYVTVDVQRRFGLPANQVIGFGGDLDTNRLRYILQKRNLLYKDAFAVGEHGPNAVPVYQGEEDYAGVLKELRTFWTKLVSNVDVVRNLATADLLGDLVHSVATDARRVHVVCAHDAMQGLPLTWPFVIGRLGAEQPASIPLQENAAKALSDLIAQRKERLSSKAAV
jgi:malate/lactate dehydrogenase